MKKISLIIVALFCAFNSYAQMAVNQDGTVKFRGNVAIFVDSKFYTFQDNKAVRSVDNQTAAVLKTALRALAMEKFQNICFGVVNRDDEATRQVEELLEENKMEDYLDGISVKAKNQGADYLFIVESTIYGESNAAAQIQISTRLIDVESNMGYHDYYRSGAIVLSDEEKMRTEVSKLINTFSTSLENNLMNIFPEQYFIAQSRGKECSLGQYQPNGKILPTDKFYAFSFQKDNLQIGTASAPIQVIENIAICQNPTIKDGQFIATSDRQISNTSNIVLFRNVEQPLLQGTNQMRVTFFGLNSDDESYDGLIKDRINNAVFSAITHHPGLQLIEHDHLSSLKKERELQKSEDFINGHTVEQMRAIGAEILIKIESFQRNGANVSIKLSTISVEQNKIIRTIDIKTSLDNIENELYKQICDRFSFPCVIKKIDKHVYELTSMLSLREGDKCIIENRKATENPITGEVSYNKIDVCSMSLAKYKGNKSIMSINKEYSADDLTDIEEKSKIGMVTFRIDGSGIESDLNNKTEVQEKAEKAIKKQKRKDVLKKIGKALFEGSETNSETNEEIKQKAEKNIKKIGKSIFGNIHIR